MPRTSLQPTVSNETTRNKLETFQRGSIIGWYLFGQKNIVIHRAMGLLYSTINVIFERNKISTT